MQVALLVLIPLTAGAAVLGARLLRFLPGALLISALAWLAQAIAALPAVSAWSLEYVVFALVIGLIVNHTVPVPTWLREAVRTEYYIKTGLVVLGAAILVDDIARAGLLGIAQALVVVLSVWTFAFWLARRLRVDDEFATMLASAVSICGVSAAIATCGAIQGDRKKLSYVTSLVLVVAMPMMVVMPWIAKVDRHARCRRGRMARRDARHERGRRGWRRADQRCRARRGRRRQALSERADRRGRLPPDCLVDVEPQVRSRLRRRQLLERAWP